MSVECGSRTSSSSARFGWIVQIIIVPRLFYESAAASVLLLENAEVSRDTGGVRHVLVWLPGQLTFHRMTHELFVL